MNYGTESRTITIQITFTREWDIAGDGPDTDNVFIDGGITALTPLLPETFGNVLNDLDAEERAEIAEDIIAAVTG